MGCAPDGAITNPRQQTQKHPKRRTFGDFCVCSAEGRPSLGKVGIATRVNGAVPPDVPLAEVDLGSWKFWNLDDELRDGAFATLRREAPISFTRRWSRPPPTTTSGTGH